MCTRNRGLLVGEVEMGGWSAQLHPCSYGRMSPPVPTTSGSSGMSAVLLPSPKFMSSRSLRM